MSIDWALVGGAFCGGLVLTLLLAARRQSSEAARRGLIAGALFISTLALLLATPFQAASQPEAASVILETSPTPLATASPTRVSALAPVTAQAALSTSTLEPPPTQPLATAPPPRLRIASLGVDAEVVPVTIDEGQWNMEPLGNDVGRLDTTGARPGDAFAMVLVGHITLTASRRGPFAELQHIPRDGVVSYVADGVEYVYRVRSVRRLEPDDVKSLYLRDGRVLLLLTCTDFDPERRVYANRLLVEATLSPISGPQQ
jgi:LPXTG-site transpeptidase (sortase) family protein